MARAADGGRGRSPEEILRAGQIKTRARIRRGPPLPLDSLAGLEPRSSEEQLRLALECGEIGTWSCDLDRDELVCSPGAAAILGLPAQAPAGIPAFLTRVHTQDLPRVMAVFEQARACGEGFEAEFRLRQPDDRPVWVLMRGRLLCGDAPAFGPRLMGVVHDISARKRLEEDLRRLNEQLEHNVSERTEELAGSLEQMRWEVSRRKEVERALRGQSAMLEAFFKHSLSPIAFLDASFRYIRVNEAFARAGSRRPEEWVGLDHFTVFPSEENRAIFESVAASGNPHQALARPLTSSDHPESTVYWDWTLTPLADASGKTRSLVLSLEDVTERKRGFDQLRARTRELQELALELIQAEDRERRRLAEILHEDLQQLLVGAKLQLTVLAGRFPEQEQLREAIGQISGLLNDSVRKTRELSHELGSPVLDQSGLAEALAWLARQSEQKFGLQVRLDIQPECEPRSEILRLFLYRAVQELLFNVHKHAGTSQAHLRIRRGAGEIRVLVVDRGLGFDARGLRIHGGKAGGLGLLSMRERLQFLGGKLWVRSRPGAGTAIALRVPEEQVETEKREAKRKATQARLALRRRGAPRAPGTSVRVLLADDHQVLRQGLAALLAEEADIQVVGQASNGREAVAMAERLRPDVIIMDVAMPELDGIAATREIVSRHPGIRVIGLSMFDEADMAETMLQAGADLFLPKAGASEELLAAIRGER